MESQLQSGFLAPWGRKRTKDSGAKSMTVQHSQEWMAPRRVPSYLCFWIFMTQSLKRSSVRKLLGNLIVYSLAIWESMLLTGELIRDIIRNSMHLNIPIKRVVATLGSAWSCLRFCKLLSFCSKSKALGYKHKAPSTWNKNSGGLVLNDQKNVCLFTANAPFWGLNLILFKGSVIKNLPAMQELQETWVQSLSREDPLEEGMAPHSSILAWRIPGTKDPGGGRKELDMTKVT